MIYAVRMHYAANWTCPDGYTMCYGSRQCVLTWFTNDGENDCNVGTDELAEYLGKVNNFIGSFPVMGWGTVCSRPRPRPRPLDLEAMDKASDQKQPQV